MKIIFNASKEEFTDSSQMRSTGEILDELDKTYRMNWACVVEARIKGEEVGGNINKPEYYLRTTLCPELADGL